MFTLLPTEKSRKEPKFRKYIPPQKKVKMATSTEPEPLDDAG